MVLTRRLSANIGSRVRVAVLLKGGVQHGAWPPPAQVLESADFFVGASFQEVQAQLAGAPPTAVVWAPGVAAAEVSSLCGAYSSIEWVHSFSAGVDSLRPFFDDARSEAVSLTNGRGAFSDSLAEYAMAAALHFNKQVPRSQANKQAKKWDNFKMGVLKGKTMGFVGWGSIAHKTAMLAKAFGMKVVACRRSPAAESDNLAERIYGVEDKLQLFRRADFVVSSLPDTPETRDFCGAAEFAEMKPTGVFISLGRGAAVDEDALFEALASDRIAGAALDVYKTEPLPLTSPLWGVAPAQLYMTAHNADLTDDYFDLGWGIWHDNLAALLSPPPIQWATPFDPKQGY
ncbi:D-isomer specific 2-hydroxyacid dehydrogenase [Pelagophyceae sp. CCMP2097]|nr:D-isomer specific 2-hydroxyacid dehydrogenase [Pelagophyceae sp. CCMP2097]